MLKKKHQTESNSESGAVIKIVESSGHNLHREAVDYLRERLYEVDISPYYVDAYTDKPREVDIIATKTLSTQFGRDYDCSLVLSIDCKYLSGPAVFWMFENERPREALKVYASSYGQYLSNQSCIYFRPNEVARLFQSANSRGTDAESDPIYKACIQAINGLIYARARSRGASILFPIVVVGGPGNLYSASEPEKPLSSVLVHIDYSYYPNRDTSKPAIREPFYVLVTRKENLGLVNSDITQEGEQFRAHEERDRAQREYDEAMMRRDRQLGGEYL